MLLKNFKIFFNNWFSSISLLKELKLLGFLCIATVRPNRITDKPFKVEKKKDSTRGRYVTMTDPEK